MTTYINNSIKLSVTKDLTSKIYILLLRGSEVKNVAERLYGINYYKWIGRSGAVQDHYRLIEIFLSSHVI